VLLSISISIYRYLRIGPLLFNKSQNSDHRSFRPTSKAYQNHHTITLKLLYCIKAVPQAPQDISNILSLPSTAALIFSTRDRPQRKRNRPRPSQPCPLSFANAAGAASCALTTASSSTRSFTHSSTHTSARRTYSATTAGISSPRQYRRRPGWISASLLASTLLPFKDLTPSAVHAITPSSPSSTLDTIPASTERPRWPSSKASRPLSAPTCARHSRPSQGLDQS
jgi:hypothetical protein